MNDTKSVTVEARRYEDYDDSLAAALADVAEDEGAESWQCEAHWETEDREAIVVTVRCQS